jgi:hypothetical protein
LAASSVMAAASTSPASSFGGIASSALVEPGAHIDSPRSGHGALDWHASLVRAGKEPVYFAAAWSARIRKSLRLRTAFWNLVFFTVLLVFFAAALYAVMAYSLERQLDQSLVSQASTAADLFLRELRKFEGDPLDAATQTVSKLRLRGRLLAIFSERELLAATVPLEHQEVAAITESMGREFPASVRAAR